MRVAGRGLKTPGLHPAMPQGARKGAARLDGLRPLRLPCTSIPRQAPLHPYRSELDSCVVKFPTPLATGSRDGRALVALAGLGGVWGGSFLFIKVIVDETSALDLVAGRLFLGALVVVLFQLYRRRSLGWTPALAAKAAALAAVSNVLPFFLIALGEQHIDSGAASVLNSSMPIFTAVFGALFLAEEHFTLARVGGLILGFLGVAVLTGQDALRIADADALGQLAVVGAAACYGLGSTYARTLLRDQDPLALSALQLSMGTLLVTPLMLAAEGAPSYSLSVEAALSLLALGVGGTGLAYIVYLWLIETTGSVRASLVTYVIPVTGLFLGWAVLGEHVGLNTAAGFGLIASGVAAVMRGQAPARAARMAARGAAPGRPGGL